MIDMKSCRRTYISRSEELFGIGFSLVASATEGLGHCQFYFEIFTVNMAEVILSVATISVLYINLRDLWHTLFVLRQLLRAQSRG